MRATVLGVVGLCVLALVGCGGDDEAQGRRAQAEATLDQRQNVSTAMARYDEVLAGAREAIASTAGTGAWSSVGSRRDDQCLEFGADLTDLNAVSSKTPSFLAAPIADDRWAATLEAVSAEVAPAGFTDVDMRQDQPGRHEVRLTGAEGATITLMSKSATIVSLVSGCHRRDGRAPDVELSSP